MPLLSPWLGSWTRPAVPAILQAPTPGRHLAVQTSILTSEASTAGSPRRFTGIGTLSYRALARTRSFGDMLEPRYIIRARPLDQRAVTHSYKDGFL
jgi:hypothetical protein